MLDEDAASALVCELVNAAAELFAPLGRRSMRSAIRLATEQEYDDNNDNCAVEKVFHGSLRCFVVVFPYYTKEII